MEGRRGPRILLVVNVEWYFWSHRLNFARALRQRGYDVVVAAGVERGQQAMIEADGFRFVPLRMRRGRFRLREELAALADLIRLYRRERPDLVYQTTIKPILYGAMAARVAGISRILNAVPGLGYAFSGHGTAAVIRSRAVAAAYWVALRGAGTHAVFQTDDDLRRFVGLGIVPRDRVSVLRYPGVDIRDFTPSMEPPGVPVVLLAARLIWDKGVAEFVEAVRLVRDRGIPCRAVIVGVPDTTNPNTVPADRLEEWQRTGVVEWCGLRSDMADVFAQSSIVVLPTYYGEGIPRVLLEAAASGRPLVATDWPGCREVVRHGENGLLVMPRSVPDLAAAIERLLRDPDLRARMGANGRALAEREFADDILASQVVDLCDAMMAR